MAHEDKGRPITTWMKSIGGKGEKNRFTQSVYGLALPRARDRTCWGSLGSGHVETRRGLVVAASRSGNDKAVSMIMHTLVINRSNSLQNYRFDWRWVYVWFQLWNLLQNKIKNKKSAYILRPSTTYVCLSACLCACDGYDKCYMAERLKQLLNRYQHQLSALYFLICNLL